MDILGFIKGELLEIIEFNDDSRDTLAWRFPDDDHAIKKGAQLIVRESQMAQFVYLGQFGDAFGPGKHTLVTENIPVLTKLKGWKYGFESPFKADVYYVVTRLFSGNKWGTSNPIMMRDQAPHGISLTPLPPVGTAFHDHLASLPDTLPEPPRPVNPGISFRSAWWNGRILGIEVKINRQVSTRLRVNVRLSRDRRSKIPPRTTSRKMIREIRVMSGVATTRFRIPRGLKPVLVTASYPGDRLFKAASVKRKPSSVRKLTR